jgi:hypothetical protein
VQMAAPDPARPPEEQWRGLSRRVPAAPPHRPAPPAQDLLPARGGLPRRGPTAPARGPPSGLRPAPRHRRGCRPLRRREPPPGPVLATWRIHDVLLGECGLPLVPLAQDRLLVLGQVLAFAVRATAHDGIYPEGPPAHLFRRQRSTLSKSRPQTAQCHEDTGEVYACPVIWARGTLRSRNCSTHVEPTSP